MQGLFEYTGFLIRKNTNRILFSGNERMKSNNVKQLLGLQCFYMFYMFLHVLKWF